ncbi:MAG: hypothetical protein QOJ08_1120, partial [Ilumatobacteraceae bacterium]
MSRARGVHEFTTCRMWLSGVVDRNNNVPVDSSEMAVDDVPVTTVCAAVHIRSERKAAAVLIAIDILKWPGVNVAFLFSFVLSIVLALAAIPYARR